MKYLGASTIGNVWFNIEEEDKPCYPKLIFISLNCFCLTKKIAKKKIIKKDNL